MNTEDIINQANDYFGTDESYRRSNYIRIARGRGH